MTTPDVTHEARQADIPADGLAVGIDLGGTNIGAGVIDIAGNVFGRSRAKTRAEDGVDPVLDRVAQCAHEACAHAGVDIARVAAVGIGAPGPVQPSDGVVLEAVNLRWDHVPAARLLAQRLGGPEVFLDNDVNVAVFGESRMGAGRGATDILGCWVGTGVGGGLILDGRIYYGKHFSAGEIGHMILVPGAAPGSRSLEHNCSRTAIVARITQLVEANRKSIVPALVDGKMHKVKSKTLAEAYNSGDELTVEVIQDAAQRLGMGIGSIVTLLSLERVVLGGGLTEALGDPWVEHVRDAVVRTVFPDVVKQVDVVASELEDDAGIVGAGLIALHRLGV